MNAWHRAHPVVVLVVVAVFAFAGCGGDDDDGSESTESSGESGTAASVAGSDRTTLGTDDTSSDAGSGGDAEEGAAGDAADGASGATTGCDTWFPMAEIEDWFGEPATLTVETTESLGQTVCTWETIEDPEDSDDLAFQLVIAQVYSGDPIPGGNFADPSIFDDARMIDGIGDLAYATDLLGTDYAFVDGDVAGFLGYSDVNMGDVDAPKRHTAEETEALFRLFHERVTG